MTVGEAAGLALKVHGAVWVAAVAAYYKYGDRTELFEKAVRGNRSARQSLRDNIATELQKQLAPVVRDATRDKSTILDAGGGYVERPADFTISEPFYQAIRDFVTSGAGSLLDYRQMLIATDRWRAWARRLSHCILSLVVWETLILGVSLFVFSTVDPGLAPNPYWYALAFAPTGLIVLILLVTLGLVHSNQASICGLRERYDPEA